MKTIQKEKSKISLYLQFIFSIAVILSIIFYFINRQNISYLEFFLGITLVIMGYNNKQFYQRKNMTILYLIIGISLIIFSIVQFLGVQDGRSYLLQ